MAFAVGAVWSVENGNDWTEEVGMLGFKDPWITAAFILCILSTLLCVVYGGLNWNKGDEELSNDDKKWAEDEEKLEQEL